MYAYYITFHCLDEHTMEDKIDYRVTVSSGIVGATSFVEAMEQVTKYYSDYPIDSININRLTSNCPVLELPREVVESVIGTYEEERG